MKFADCKNMDGSNDYFGIKDSSSDLGYSLGPQALYEIFAPYHYLGYYWADFGRTSFDYEVNGNF